MHRFFLLLIMPIIIIILAAIYTYKINRTKPSSHVDAASIAASTELQRLKKYGDKIKTFIKRKNLNNNFCFLADMQLPSESNRFFVYDLKNDSVIQSGLVAHGYGRNNHSGISFSNMPGSNYTSLGKYKIGNAYNGRFGLAYKLYGLDSTNSNAFNRFVVLHSHGCVPATAISLQRICMSQGCPTVSTVFLNLLKKHLDETRQPVLLYIFY